MTTRLAALLPSMLLVGLLAGALAPTPASSSDDEPSVQMTVTPAR